MVKEKKLFGKKITLGRYRFRLIMTELPVTPRPKRTFKLNWKKALFITSAILLAGLSIPDFNCPRTSGKEVSEIVGSKPLFSCPSKKGKKTKQVVKKENRERKPLFNCPSRVKPDEAKKVKPAKAKKVKEKKSTPLLGGCPGKKTNPEAPSAEPPVVVEEAPILGDTVFAAKAGQKNFKAWGDHDLTTSKETPQYKLKQNAKVSTDSAGFRVWDKDGKTPQYLIIWVWPICNWARIPTRLPALAGQ